MSFAPDERTWFGQPRGLTILFMTETWEKFSFYGMRAILVYYMIKALHFDQGKASLVYGLYTSFVYFTPIVGGAISDRWLGPRRSVILGGLMMAVGHFMMAWPQLFYAALGAIAVGNGFYLSSLPSQITGLYAPHDPRRTAAYNIYYAGINLGGFLAPLVCGALGELYGWHYGFAAAGVGMCIGLATFVGGLRLLPPEPARVRPARALEPRREKQGGRTFLVLLGIGAAVVLFRGAYEQMGNTVALWADADVDRHVGAYVIPGSWFQSLDPLLIFAFTPVLVALWARNAARGRDTTPVAKMALGALGLAGAFALAAAVAFFAERAGVRASWLWLTLFVTLLTAAELYILPVGLGLFARLAPRRLGATTIAAWFFAAFAGNLLAGSVGALWGRTDHALFFTLLVGLALAAALALRLLDGPARRVEQAHAAAFAAGEL